MNISNECLITMAGEREYVDITNITRILTIIVTLKPVYKILNN